MQARWQLVNGVCALRLSLQLQKALSAHDNSKMKIVHLKLQRFVFVHKDIIVTLIQISHEKYRGDCTVTTDQYLISKCCRASFILTYILTRTNM